MSNHELDVSTLSPAEIKRLQELVDAGSAGMQSPANQDVQLCWLALSGNTEVSSTLDPKPILTQSANSRFASPRFVGSGSFGIVFVVYDHSLGMEVAIKLLRPSRNSPIAKQRFFEEARITANLTHPGIVRLFDSGTVGQIPYITSAIVTGGSLADWIAKNPQGMKPEVACTILLAVAEAVAYAHSKLTYHRDIKPSNILMAFDNDLPSGADPIAVRPVLTDFGLAKRWDRTEAGLTLEGDILGTARYMSPEQASGALEEYSVASEVFTLGIILFEMLTGRGPFDGKNNTEIRKSIIYGRPVSLKQYQPMVSSDLGAIVRKCLEKHPENRYESVSALVKDLRRYTSGQPVEASSPSLVRMLAWKAKNHPIVTSFIAIAVVTIAFSIAAVGYSWWNQLQIAEHERQTKIEYVALFGKLVDDVVSGEKNQQVAILESLQGFQSAIEKDLQERPQDQELHHLLSLVFHYESVTYPRMGKTVEAMQSRIRSVSILQKLRYDYPENAKFRFQYLYGIVFMSESIDSPAFAELRSQMREQIGFTNGQQIVEASLPEMDRLLEDFPKPEYQDAVNQFRLTVARVIDSYQKGKADDLMIKAIHDSKVLADRFPETLSYINPAIRGYWQLSSFEHNRGDMDQSLAYAKQATDCFDEYLGHHMDKTWVESLYIEKQYWHVDTLFRLNKSDEALLLSEKCLEINDKRLGNSAFRVSALDINFHLRAIRYRIFLDEGRTKEQDNELEKLESAAQMAIEFDPCRVTCLNLGESIMLPSSVLGILRGEERNGRQANE